MHPYLPFTHRLVPPVRHGTCDRLAARDTRVEELQHGATGGARGVGLSEPSVSGSHLGLVAQSRSPNRVPFLQQGRLSQAGCCKGEAAFLDARGANQERWGSPAGAPLPAFAPAMG